MQPWFNYMVSNNSNIHNIEIDFNICIWDFVGLCAAAVKNASHAALTKPFNLSFSAHVMQQIFFLPWSPACLSQWSFAETKLLERWESLRNVVQSLFCEGITLLSLVPIGLAPRDSGVVMSG